MLLVIFSVETAALFNPAKAKLCAYRPTLAGIRKPPLMLMQFCSILRKAGGRGHACMPTFFFNVSNCNQVDGMGPLPGDRT